MRRVLPMLILLAAAPALALGIYGGANSCRLLGSDTAGVLPDFERGYDWTAGLFQDLDFGPNVALRGALQMTRRRSWQDVEAGVREELVLGTLDLPVDLLLRHARRRGAFVSLGASLHLPRMARYCEATRLREGSLCLERDIRDELTEREITFSLGAGYEFGSGFFWLRYNMGLENLYRDNAEGLDYTSEVISAVIGLRIF